MLMPSLFGENLLDDFFDVPSFRGFVPAKGQEMMKTDIKETEKEYEISMNLPGFKKEDVRGELKDGYLTIHAETSQNKEDKDQKGKYIRRERYSGSCSRSFYVGDQVTEQDIKAKFEDGVLKLEIPKQEEKKQVEDKHFISIEG